MPGTDSSRRVRTLGRLACGVGLVLATVLVSQLLQEHVARTYSIPSGSMEPTLKQGDRIVAERLSGQFERGDIITFTDPADWTGTTLITTLVKRVIGTPGDEVACCTTSGQLMVNGSPLPEPYLHESLWSEASSAPFSVTVPAGHLWVMGDNRRHSVDSRGGSGADPEFLPISHVTGRVIGISWPGTRWRVFSPRNSQVSTGPRLARVCCRCRAAGLAHSVATACEPRGSS